MHSNAAPICFLTINGKLLAGVLDGLLSK
eukprot:jgi/Chrzof1/3542/UNPLg00751.t1